MPPFCLAFSISTFYEISSEIVAFFSLVNCLAISGVLKPLNSFGKQTTVRNEHHSKLRGSIKQLSTNQHVEMVEVTVGIFVILGSSYILKSINI